MSKERQPRSSRSTTLESIAKRVEILEAHAMACDAEADEFLSRIDALERRAKDADETTKAALNRLVDVERAQAAKKRSLFARLFG